MSQPEPPPGVPVPPGWRLGLLVPAGALAGQIIPFVLLLVPVPVAVLTDQRGWRAGLAWSLAAGAAAVLFRWAVLGFRAEEWLVALAGGLVPLVTAGMGLAGGLAYRRDRHAVVTYLAPAFFAAGVLGLAWGYVRWVMNVDLVRAVVEMAFGVLEEALVPPLEAGGVSAAQLEAWRAGLEERKEAILMFFPASTAVTLGAWSAISQWLAGRWLLAVGRPLRPGKPFVRWRFPWILAWGYMIGQILLLALRIEGVAWPEQTMRFVGVNLVLFFTHLFFVEGLAVVWFYLTKWGAGRGVRWIVTLLLVSPFLPLMVPVGWLGMLDAWLDFRKLQREGGP